MSTLKVSVYTNSFYILGVKNTGHFKNDPPLKKQHTGVGSIAP